MIPIKYVVEPPGKCFFCNTPTFYGCDGVKCCPVCAVSHKYSDLGIKKVVETEYNVIRNTVGTPIIVDYTFDCGHTIPAEEMSIKSKLDRCKRCPVCKKGVFSGKTYKCNICGNLFLKKSSVGNPLYCAKCAKKRKRESYLRANKKEKKQPKRTGINPRVDVIRISNEVLDVMDFVHTGTGESDFIYHGF